MRNPLEPLLDKLARDFSDDQDLSDRLRKLYQVRGDAKKRASVQLDTLQFSNYIKAVLVAMYLTDRQQFNK